MKYVIVKNDLYYNDNFNFLQNIKRILYRLIILFVY